MNIHKLIETEAKSINRTFKANGIRAKASAQSAINVEVGFLRYPLQLHPGEKFAKVEGVIRELSANVARNRQRLGIGGAVPVLPVTGAGLALEVPHPSPVPLLWSPRKTTTTPPHTMLIGRSYLSAPKYEYVSFADTPHALIAGITGAGKSVLLQTMLLSLCANTSPDELKLVLVDLKNEDLVPFEKLPHVIAFAGTRESAVRAIASVVVEKDKRVAERGYKPYRLVLVIDELAQLAGDGEVKSMLGDLASIGRSKAINLIGATQHPTDKGGLGTLLKANFPIRLVGMVAPGQSYIATGRPQTHADLLPGKGAFLRCQGPDVYRFQSFYIEPGDVAGLTTYIAKEVWKRPVVRGGEVVAQPVVGGGATGGEVVVGRLHTSETEQYSTTGGESDSILFPITNGRSLTDNESAIVRTMAARGDFDYAGQLSMNRACIFVFGCKDAQRMAWVRAALSADTEPKIIKLRRAG